MFLRLILALLLLLPLPAIAERRVALVMAAEDYRALRALENPVADALAVEDMLAGLGFEVTVETDRDLRRMRRALEDFRLDYAGADVALIFFAGHGVEIGGVNYLLPVDAAAGSAAEVQATGLPLAEVQAALAGVAPVGIVLLDACREDPFGGAGTAGTGRGAAALEDAAAPAPRPGLGRIGRADGVLFAFSAAPGEVASDGAGAHSPFAEALLRHFATPGVEVRTALTLVQQDVYDRSRGAQLPYVESGLPRLFFAAATADLAERDRLLIAMADLPPDLRAEIETLAAEKDMPLAPLFGALFSAGLAGAGPEERAAALVDSADAFLRFRRELQALAPDDPEVAALRARAEEALSLGAYAEARAALDAAVKIDAGARDALRDNYRARTLSQAQTHALAAQAARADLDYPRALVDLNAAIALYAELEGPALSDADRAAYTDLIWDQGDLYRMTGFSGLALAAYRRWEGVAAARVAEAPGNADWLRNHAVARVNVGDMLAVQGDLAAARVEYDAALVVARDLAARPGAELKWRHDVFVALSKVADMSQAQGDIGTALSLHLEGLEVLEGLVRDFPDRRDVARDLSVAHDRVGDLRRFSGDLAGAMAEYETALAQRRALVQADPANAGFRAELVTSQDKIGDLKLAQGDGPGALAVFREGIAMAEALVADDPGNMALRRDLSRMRLKLGDALQATGDVAGARAAWDGALAERRALVAADPGNTEWLRDLSTAQERLGTQAMNAGDFAGAAAAFAETLEVARQLVALDPSNADRQRDLTIALDRLGDLAVRQGDWAGAAGFYAESFEMTRAKADSDPQNAEWQFDLVAGLVRMAMFDTAPRVKLEEARDILLRLEAEGRVDPARLGWRKLVEDLLAQQAP